MKKKFITKVNVPIRDISYWSDPFVASPTSQLILQPFCRFTYVTAHFTTLPQLQLCQSTSPTSSGEPPMIYNDLYIDFIYMHLIAPYGAGNATHDRGSILLIQLLHSASVSKFSTVLLFPKNVCIRRVGSLHDLSLNQNEKDNERLSSPHYPSLPYQLQLIMSCVLQGIGREREREREREID